MNKLLLLFLCVCLVGCSSTSTTTVPATIQENEQEQIKPRDLHVVALGDSLTQGVGDGKGG
ncbi:GDSL family lipase, partial [Geobacillus sp. LEMMJ02]